MVTYTITVVAEDSLVNSVKQLGVRLVGTEDQSEFIWVTGIWTLFGGGKAACSTVELTTEKTLGDLTYVDLKKYQPFFTFESQWFVKKVEVTTPLGKTFTFPVYLYLHKSRLFSFREGTALIPAKEPNDNNNRRQTELQRRAQTYRFAEYKPSWPKMLALDESGALPSEFQFSTQKSNHFFVTAGLQFGQVTLDTFLEGLLVGEPRFQSIEEIKTKMSTTPISEYVVEHWKEDSFFGYQFLNGLNPIMIRKCSSVPENMAVTDELVSLENNLKLSEEMQKGNVFLCDYKVLEGVTTNEMDDAPVYLTAPLVLLHLTPSQELKPVAIQLRQNTGADVPVFLPSDPELDWLLAKTFVRNADFTKHQIDTHLLRTHLLAEVFAVSMLRNFPKAHPLYKLLVHHTRYTFQINKLARETLINRGGIFAEFSASNTEGVSVLARNGLQAVTYDSLCIKEDVKARGMESPNLNYYYRDDGCKLWDIIQSFVDDMIKFYYKSDDEVETDAELQKYIQDIFIEGFLSNADSGIPQSFDKVEDLVKFVTMVIFTCSAQHAAVNNGQLDFGSWMPNFPTALMVSPPTTKGSVTEDTFIQALPSKRTTGNAIATLAILSAPPADFLALGEYCQDHFTEAEPLRFIEVFRGKLKALGQEIDTRNETLPLPYTYLKPDQMENSITI